MKPRQITKSRTFLGYIFGWAFWCLTLLFYVSTYFFRGDEDEAVWFLVVIPAGLLLAFLFWYRKKRLLKERTVALAAYATQHQLQVVPPVDTGQYLSNIGALDELHNARNSKVWNVMKGDDWVYCDFSYDIYRRTRRGEYRAGTIYYGVMSSTLPRSLPHVFFDSKTARRRQFRFHFARSQRHVLEGGFDKYFDTYFPPGYTIDSMSFISPDVMWQLKEAADYDIEIIGNQLLLYGPLYAPEQQLPDMSAKIKRIKKELLDNILTYRDERLPGEQGRQQVAALGAKLKGSRFWKIVSVVTVVLYIIGRILLDIYAN